MTGTTVPVCTVNRLLAPLLPRAFLVILAAVILPRILLFFYLGGELPQPGRDQALYIHTAGQIVSGEGFSFSSDLGLMKNLRNTSDSPQQHWTGDESYMFGLAPVDTPTAVMEPGYSVLLALFFSLFGAVSGSVFSLNLLFALGGAFAVRKLVMDVWGAQSGLMAAILWSIYPPFVYYSAYAMTETAHFAMLMISSMLLLSAGRGEGKGFLAGVATGVFFLIRATALFLVPFQIAYLAWRKQWKAMLFLSAGFLVAVSPWMVRNWISLGEPVLMPTKGSLNLWMRNNPEVLALEGIFVPDNIPVNDLSLLEYPSTDSIPGELARSRALGASARNYIFSNPRLMVWLGWNRAIDFLAPGGSTLGTRGMIAGLVIYPLILFGVLGLWRSRHRPEAVFLFALFVLYLLVHALAHGGVRYRLPVDAVFLIGVALGTCCGEGKK
ncbi:MAG: glycosyltransferase family 39 protein [Candidatus Sabulitectum sp.]|nr:glycosyltransferase family 39 protein [Candidatus Sabulitectum sp.]